MALPYSHVEDTWIPTEPGNLTPPVAALDQMGTEVRSRSLMCPLHTHNSDDSDASPELPHGSGPKSDSAGCCTLIPPFIPIADFPETLPSKSLSHEPVDH